MYRTTTSLDPISLALLLDALTRLTTYPKPAIYQVKLEYGLITEDDMLPMGHCQVLPSLRSLQADMVVVASQQGLPCGSTGTVTTGQDHSTLFLLTSCGECRTRSRYIYLGNGQMIEVDIIFYMSYHAYIIQCNTAITACCVLKWVHIMYLQNVSFVSFMCIAFQYGKIMLLVREYECLIEHYTDFEITQDSQYITIVVTYLSIVASFRELNKSDIIRHLFFSYGYIECVFHRPSFNTWWPRQNCCIFADDIFKLNFLVLKLLYFDSTFTEICKRVCKASINNKPVFIQITVWRCS